MGMIKLLTSLAFVTIFGLAIIGYSIGFATDNQAVVNLNEDSDFSSADTSIRSDLGSFDDSSESSLNILMESKIASGDDNVEGGGQFKTGPNDIISASKTIISASNEKIFGKGNEFGILFTVVISFIILIVGLYIWKTWKGGSPD